MRIKQKIFIMLIIFCVMIPVVICSFLVLPWLTLAFGLILSPNPPKPQITYGEFPFELIYEINNETVVVKDTVVCKYDGVGINEGVGKFRKWKYFLKNAGGTSLLLTEDEERRIYCSVGDAEYYMNDEQNPTGRPLEPHLFEIKKTTSTLDYDSLKPIEIMEHYNIKIISWNFSEPIENSFIK